MMSPAASLRQCTEDRAIRFVKRTQSPEAGTAGILRAQLRQRAEREGRERFSKTSLRRPWRDPRIRVSPEEFRAILQVTVDPVVVREQHWWLGRRQRYTLRWEGYHVSTLAAEGEMAVPPGAQVIVAEHVRFR